MDPIASLLEQLPLPEITRLLRRTFWVALIVAGITLGATIAIDRALVGLGACIGLALGLGNVHLIVRSIARINANGVTRPIHGLASNTFIRLGMTAVIVIALSVASTALGIGTAGGIAFAYLLLIGSLVRTVLRGTTGITP